MKQPQTNAVVTAIALALLAGMWFAYRVAAEKRKKSIQAAYITQGIGLLNAARVRVMNSYDGKGQWPSSNEESGLPPSSAFASDSVSGLAVSEGGVITVTFNEKSGVTDGKLRLTPHVGMDTRWECTTPSFKEIATWAPQCRFDP